MDLSHPDRDMGKLHPVIRQRWFALLPDLEAMLGCHVLMNEGYRSDERQGWLYGAGRTREALDKLGINPDWARPEELKVTNAWSARLSAHGWTVNGAPASAALDVVPLGADGKPWTADDPWGKFVMLTTDTGVLAAKHGLVHFHSPGKMVWDKPHIQAVEWSDMRHQLEGL